MNVYMYVLPEYIFSFFFSSMIYARASETKEREKNVEISISINEVS